MHFTHASDGWQNPERLFAEVTERCVRWDSHTSFRALETAMAGYLERRNKTPKPLYGLLMRI